jgi:hypothetical protein
MMIYPFGVDSDIWRSNIFGYERFGEKTCRRRGKKFRDIHKSV